MTNTDFQVKTEVFEGPLDVLLSLIEKRKLLINEISLARVTDDYISYIHNQPQMSLQQSSHFIVVASTLLLIKSKSLLSTIQLSQEESESIEELELRLKIYQRIKEASETVQLRFGAQPMFDTTGSGQMIIPEDMFAPAKNITLEKIQELMQSLTKVLPKPEKVPQAVVKQVISLEETMNNLTNRIKSNLQMSFKEFSGHGGKQEKINVVVSFLAMLELVKQGMMMVKQDAHFEDITMETREVSTPHYSA